MSLENTDLVSRYFEERQMVAVSQSLFKWMSSMREDTFDQIADALVHFSNEINEDKEIRIVFSIVDEEPKYFRFFAEMGELTLAGQDSPKTMVAVELLEQIDIDEFLDEVLAGNQIIKDNSIKRFIASYEFI
jgi:hypothetical protein